MVLAGDWRTCALILISPEPNKGQAGPPRGHIPKFGHNLLSVPREMSLSVPFRLFAPVRSIRAPICASFARVRSIRYCNIESIPAHSRSISASGMGPVLYRFIKHPFPAVGSFSFLVNWRAHRRSSDRRGHYSPVVIRRTRADASSSPVQTAATSRLSGTIGSSAC